MNSVNFFYFLKKVWYYFFMKNIDHYETVTITTLPEARQQCYSAFAMNIDGGSSIEDSVRIITQSPKKRIHRYWQEGIVRRNENGVITAGISPCHYKVRLNDKIVTMLAIGDVFSTEKGTDAIAELFSRLFTANSSTAISVLYPFSDTYYSRYGYTSVGANEEKITLSHGYIDRYADKSYQTKLKAVDHKSQEKLEALYKKATQKINLSAIRDDALDWNLLSYAIDNRGFIGWKLNEGRLAVRELYGVCIEDLFSFFNGMKYDIMTIEDHYRTGIGEDITEHNNMNPIRELRLNCAARVLNLDATLKTLAPLDEGNISM